MRYDTPMKYVLMLMLALAFALPGSAGQREDALLKGLLGLGAQAIEAQQAGKVAAPAPQPEPQAQQSRDWGDRGQEMLTTFVSGMSGGKGEQPFSKLLSGSLKESFDILVNEYKEQYKEEGRAYATELGDKIVERVREDPKISSSITSIQILCWCVIVYLTLVTIIMFASLLYLKRANARVLAAVEAMQGERTHCS